MSEYYWLLRTDGQKMATAGRKREDALQKAADWAVSCNRTIEFVGPTGDTGSVRPENVHRLDPDPVTKKAFKEKVKQGVVFRAVGENETGQTFVTGTSAHGGRWVALVEVHKGYVRKIIR